MDKKKRSKQFGATVLCLIAVVYSSLAASYFSYRAEAFTKRGVTVNAKVVHVEELRKGTTRITVEYDPGDGIVGAECTSCPGVEQGDWVQVRYVADRPEWGVEAVGAQGSRDLVIFHVVIAVAGLVAASFLVWRIRRAVRVGR